MRVVIDTDILVSALFVAAGLPILVMVLALVLQGRTIPQYVQRNFSGYREVPGRKVSGFSVDSIKSVPGFLEKVDRKFREITCSFSAYTLITGNPAPFPSSPIATKAKAATFGVRHPVLTQRLTNKLY
jgi:hypothetical protein